MKVVVTGGCGFIGSHLTERLLAEGCQVTVIDNCAVGRRSNLAAVEGAPGLTCHKLDVAEVEAVNRLVAGADWVFHLAAMADIVPSIQNPLVYHRANVDGTASVLEACRAHAVKRLVYAASSSCYGIPDIYPTPETADIRPMYPYALTKYLGERMVLHWAQCYGLPAVSLRLFNVYGPRARTAGTYGAVFGVFLGQKLAGKPFTVVGDGEQTRDFTDVSDVVDALITAARSDVAGDMFNVGSDSTESVNRLVALLGGDKIHIPKRPGEPDCTFADISKIQATLGWRPTVSFEDGVARLLARLDDWRDAPVWTADQIAVTTRDWFNYLGKDDAAPGRDGQADPGRLFTTPGSAARRPVADQEGGSGCGR